MIAVHESFPAPLDQTVSLWRYMNLSKFVWMLQKKALYFCRCDLLGDPYEGYYPKTLACGCLMPKISPACACVSLRCRMIE